METMTPPGLPELRAQMAELADGLTGVLAELQEIARGIHPAILTDGGLARALKILAQRSAVPVQLDVRLTTRLPQPVEVAAYYVVSEALTNTAKHAHASVVHVVLDVGHGLLELSIRDDGSGGADPTRGSGLMGLTDRVEALGGTIDVTSAAGQGTTLHVTLPAEARLGSPSGRADRWDGPAMWWPRSLTVNMGSSVNVETLGGRLSLMDDFGDELLRMG